MKKKVFSLMMMLVFAFIGIAQAEELTVHDGTTTNGYIPMYGGYFDDFTKSEFVFPASDLAAMNGGTITSMKFYVSSVGSYGSGWSSTQQVFVKEVASTTLSAFSGTTDATIVWEGSLTCPTGAGELEITFSTPYEYNGGNLLVGVYNTTDGGYQFVYFNGENVDGASGAGSDGSSLAGVTFTQRNFLPKTTFTYTPGEGGDDPDEPGYTDGLHVLSADGTIDTVNVGSRPLNAWMAPYVFKMYNESNEDYTVTVLDFTPNDGVFENLTEVPYELAAGDTTDITIDVHPTEAGVINRQFVAIYEGNRLAHIWPITAEAYTPICPDVVLVAYELNDGEAIEPGFTWKEFMSTIWAGEDTMDLHNDYTLPYPEIPEGKDAVMKFTLDKAMMLSAKVSTGENGKVALYTEDFYGEDGPMATNNYTDPMSASQGGGGAAGPFEAVIGDETSTTSTSYVPYYQLYYNSISESLFTAEELSGAGVTRTPMTSLSWYANADASYEAHGIKIWMANVSDTELTTTSHLTSGMTLVYQGDIQPVTGWNEFVFNQGSFAWDGQSNVIVCVLRNDSEWHSGPTWKALNAGFVASAYNYSDGTVYNSASSTYTVSTMQNRPIIKMKGGNRTDASEFAINEGFENGLGDWTTIDADGDGYNWNLGSVIMAGYSIPAYEGEDMVSSESYDSYYSEPLTPDNYLVSPQVELGGTLTFWACAQDEDYGAEHFGVAVSTTGNTNPTNFTTLQEWTISSKGAGIKSTGRGNRVTRTSTWTQYTVDLSAYAGQTGYVAIRHFNCSDQFILNVDEIQLTSASTEPEEPVVAGVGPQIDSLNVLAGTYYLVASSTDDDFEVEINIDELPCPESAIAVYPVDNAQGIEPNSVTLKWQLNPYCTEWRLVFSSTYWPDDEPNNPFTIITDWSSELAEQYTVTNLFNNTNYFWRIDQRTNGGEEEGGCTTTGDVFGFTTHFNNPHNLTASDETIFEGQTVTLTWNAVVDRTYRQYRIYKDGEVIGTTAMNQINATSFVVPATELTYNMEGYEFYVTALYDEGESDPSNSVNVKVSGYSNETGINGYAYEQDGTTPIEGVTVTITGTDEFGDAHTYTATTDANGYYHVQVYVGHYTNAVANKEGYQTTVTNHELPFDVALNGQVDNVNFIMDENFVAPAHVCAETVEVDGEELVKVWWDFDFYNALIEDFETGDFTQFPWQNSASYPWTITTTNPYEGTYCMKSGGAGVANVQSDMSVTVDVPNDGLISFFGKISCESSWDYGYFYIDGTQVGSFTGAGNWTEKKYDITAGEHTFKWQYTKDGIIDANDDCFYVDYITFNMIPEPLTAGWHTYLEGEFNDALRSNLTDQPSFGYHYPTSITTQYNGFQLTKVSMFSDSEYGAVGGNYTVNIYQGGSTPGAGTLVSTKTVDLPVGLGEWVDWDLDTPVAVSGDQDLWVIWHVNQAGGLGYPAGMCNTDSNPNGDWWDGGSGWENYGGGVWTMRNFFNDGSRDVVLAAGNTPIADNNLISSNLRTFVKGDNTVTAERINPNAPVVKPAKSAMRGDRALDHYNIYRTSCYNDGPYTSENTVLLATAWRPDTAYFDVSWPEVEPGVYKWGVSVVYAGNRDDEPTVYPAEDRESDIVWSNMCDCGMGCIDKDMTIDSLVTVNVLLNSADSPEGTVVTFTNLNEGEQAAHPMDPITLDATGFYRFPSFRKGDYTVTVEHDGYETITDTPVSIWEPVDLRYVMIEILYGIDNLYVSRTGWAMWEGQVAPEPVNPDDPQGETSLSEGFEGATPQNLPAGWTMIDADGDGYNWYTLNWIDAGWDETGAHTGDQWATSASYNGTALHPDNYLVSPQVTLGGTLSFWASAQDPSYASETFGVAVSTSGNTNASEFTTIQSWTMTAKGLGAKTPDTRSGNNRIGNYYQYTVDLSAYAGQTGYVAIRHYNTYDMFRLNVDDIEMTASRAGDRHLEYYKVMCESIDHEPIFNANTTHNFCQVATDQLVEGEHYICKVAAVYSTGQGPWSEVEWQYESCENYAGTVDGVTVDGNTISWTYPEGDTPDPEPDPEGDVIVILTENNVWGDGSGYQMLLDADATAYGNEIPTSGPYTGSNYNAFEYLIPEDADCSGYATHVVSNGSVSITIPAGTYDWCITNPTGGTNWIAAQNGNVGGRQDNYVFEAGKTYEFVPAMFGSNDGVNVTITENGKIYGVAGNNAVVDNSNCRVNENFVAPAMEFVSAGASNHAAPADFNRDGWLTYDYTGAYYNAIGLTSYAEFSYGNMHPASQMAAYNGQSLTKVSLVPFCNMTGSIDIYQGGTTAPETLVYTQPISLTGVGDAATYVDVNLTTPVVINGSQSLWVIITASTYDTYPAAMTEFQGDVNGSWLYLEGYDWMSVGDAGIEGTWMVKAYVEEGTTPPTPPTPGEGILGAMIFVDGEWEAFVEAPTNTYTYEGDGQEICVRIVYDGANELPDNNYYYAMSCEECAVPEQGCAPVENLTGYYQNDPEYGEAIFVDWDEPEGVVSYELYIGGELAGTFEPGGLPLVIYGLEGYPAMTLPIGVVAVYDDCESEMVEVNVNYDEVPENNLEVALFPNPTKDNVTIQAAGMNHITVMSVLGQVVYDAEVSSDEVILNMSQFNAGVYVVRIVTANGVGTRRVTVVK